MKTWIAGAVICALAASAQAAGSPDSWIALEPPHGARTASGNAEGSFAAGSVAPGFLHDASHWGVRSNVDRDDWQSLGSDESEREGLDDLGGCSIAVAPEPSTWQLLALGSTLLGYLRMRAARKS